MKKIFWLFIIVGLFILQWFYNISFADAEADCINNFWDWDSANSKCITTNAGAQEDCLKNWWLRDNLAKTCDRSWTRWWSAIQWIRMNKTCLLNGQCGFNIYQFLGIRTSIADASSPELFVQDILLSATFFIWTIVTIALVVSGLMFIFAGATWKDPTKAKAGIKNSFIGLLIVVCSYSIIRIVQYIAKGL